MKNLNYTFGIISKVLITLLKRLLGKRLNNWNLQTHIIWATTRYTLLSSNKYGLPWLKSLSRNYTPKPKLRDKIITVKKQNEVGSYLAVAPKMAGKANSRIIYFHGGGYVTGSPNIIIEFLSNLAISTDSEILVPFYPTAPEELYPNAHIFCSNIAHAILKEYGSSDFYLGGDSAGAALFLSVFRNLSTESKSKIKGSFLISPWVEPISTGGTIQTNASKDIADEFYLTQCYNTYTQNRTIKDEYPVSFDSGNIIKLPNTLITIGTHEMLLDQTHRLNENLKAKGTETTLIEYECMFHTFWNHPSKIREADMLIHDIANWKEDCKL